jgi:FixJ family two-component response regulator
VSGKGTVWIIDGDSAARQSLLAAVRSLDFQAEAYASVEEFLEARSDDEAYPPGCLLLDAGVPGLSGIAWLEQLAQEKLHPPVIMVSADGDVPMVVRAMRAGALNFLQKPCRDRPLWEAIQEALRCDAENRKRIGRLVRLQRRLARLTAGERDVLNLLLRGRSNRQAAAELKKSVRAIEVRRAKLMHKMRADSLAELVRLTLTAMDPLGDVRAMPGNHH